MVDGVDVINMSGRIYDAHLGRFLQADPIVQAPNRIGSLNRYSYVFNNPLNATDPTGYYSWGDFWDDVKPFVGAIVGVALMIWAPWAAEAWAPMVTGMIAGGSQAAANGGNVLMGMAFGAITGSVAMGGAGWESTLMSGLVGGTISTMMGGKFGYGFVAGSVGTMIGGQVGNPVGRVIASAALGGTITELTGGKFKNGAASAAFAAMIGEVGRKANDEAGNLRREEGTTENKKVDVNLDLSEADKAARKALEIANPQSIKDNKEYGGLVYRHKGKYYATGAVSGTGDTITSADLDSLWGNLPEGALVIGEYHTHGDYSRKSRLTGRPVRVNDPSKDMYNSNNFSPSDKIRYKQIYNSVARQNPNVTGLNWVGYLGTPSGTFKAYNTAASVATGKDHIYEF